MITRALFFLLLPTTASLASSFDCTKASSQSERLICSDAELGKLDEELAAAYRIAYNSTQDRKRLKTEQIEWLKLRDACETSVCMKERYKIRIGELHKTDKKFSWLKDYAGKTTNQLVWDKRFNKFTESIAPVTTSDFGLGDGGLEGQLSDALGGPPNSVTLTDDRYLTLSACTFRFCLEKGFVWVDLNESIAIAAIVHYDLRKQNYKKYPVLIIFSKQIDATKVSGHFKLELSEWLMREGVPINMSKYFIGADGKDIGFTLRE